MTFGQSKALKFDMLEVVRSSIWLLLILSKVNYSCGVAAADRRKESKVLNHVHSAENHSNETASQFFRECTSWEVPPELSRLQASIQTPDLNFEKREGYDDIQLNFCGTSYAEISPDQQNVGKRNRNVAFHRTTDKRDEEVVSTIDGIEEGDAIDIHHTILGPNTTWPIENDLFHGSICILLRDHPHCDYDFDGENDVFFEVQIQGKFKRQPQGPLYLSLELPQTEKFKLSWPVRTAMNALVAFIRSWGYRYLHMSFGGKVSYNPINTVAPLFQKHFAIHSKNRIMLIKNNLYPKILIHHD